MSLLAFARRGTEGEAKAFLDALFYSDSHTPIGYFRDAETALDDAEYVIVFREEYGDADGPLDERYQERTEGPEDTLGLSDVPVMSPEEAMRVEFPNFIGYNPEYNN